MANKDMRRTAAKGHLTLKEQANRQAADLAPTVADLRTAGITSLQQIADALNARGVPAAKGGSWSKTQVMRLLVRLGRA